MEKQFDYSIEYEKQIIKDIEESKIYDSLLDSERLEDILRSDKVRKQYKKLLGLNDNEFNPKRIYRQ